MTHSEAVQTYRDERRESEKRRRRRGELMTAKQLRAAKAEFDAVTSKLRMHHDVRIHRRSKDA